MESGVEEGGQEINGAAGNPRGPGRVVVSAGKNTTTGECERWPHVAGTVLPSSVGAQGSSGCRAGPPGRTHEPGTRAEPSAAVS